MAVVLIFLLPYLYATISTWNILLNTFYQLVFCSTCPLIESFWKRTYKIMVSSIRSLFFQFYFSINASYGFYQTQPTYNPGLYACAEVWSLNLGHWLVFPLRFLFIVSLMLSCFPTSNLNSGSSFRPCFNTNQHCPLSFSNIVVVSYTTSDTQESGSCCQGHKRLKYLPQEASLFISPPTC